MPGAPPPPPPPLNPLLCVQHIQQKVTLIKKMKISWPTSSQQTKHTQTSNTMKHSLTLVIICTKHEKKEQQIVYIGHDILNSYFATLWSYWSTKTPKFGKKKTYGANMTKISQIQGAPPPPPSHERFHKNIFRYFLVLVFNGPIP